MSRQRKQGAFEIQSTDLRTIRIPELIAEGVRAIVKKHPYLYRREVRDAAADDPTAFSRMWNPPAKRPGHGRIFPDSKLAEVARIYRENPRRGYLAVAEALGGIPRSTAGEYIKRAGEAGLLDDYAPPRRKKG